jgi:protein-L-isoaspartate(D-aspartate) O-methyltransferase
MEMKRFTILIFACLAVTSAPAWGDDAKFAEQRMAMVAHQIESRDVNDPRTLAAMRKVPRHEFVPPDAVSAAYQDRPLGIGYGQTISQPFIVAYMTEALHLKGTEKVLEIGTGSGYQAAVLAETAQEVYSIEIIPELYKSAKSRLSRLGYKTIHLKNDDGYYGWEEHAPYDGIVVTCAAGHIPQPLIRQLKTGGRMIIPVGHPWSVQDLVIVTKDNNGKVKTKNVMPVRFVPLVREKE